MKEESYERMKVVTNKLRLTDAPSWSGDEKTHNPFGTS
jgi:hypothetical protein